MIVISGDMGGTNTRLQLTQHEGSATTIVFTRKYRAVDYVCLSEVIKEFIRDAKIDSQTIKAACLAVAGPVENGSVSFTNLPWVINEDNIADVLGLPAEKVKLINDFKAIGYGIETLDKKDLVTLQKGEYAEDAPVAVIGAGTGLGMCVVNYFQDHTLVMPTEGGHQDFAPVDDEQIALFRYLKKRLHRISVERICCGPGIVNIYKYVVAHPLYNQPESAELKRELYSAQDQAALITHYALERGDPMALRTLDIFIRVYGAVAGNLALTTLARRGLYVVGGIAPKLLKQIQQGQFMTMFTDKGRVSEILHRIPVHLVTNTDVGLQGAALFASRLALQK